MFDEFIKKAKSEPVISGFIVLCLSILLLDLTCSVKTEEIPEQETVILNDYLQSLVAEEPDQDFLDEYKKEFGKEWVDDFDTRCLHAACIDGRIMVVCIKSAAPIKDITGEDAQCQDITINMIRKTK